MRQACKHTVHTRKRNGFPSVLPLIFNMHKYAAMPCGSSLIPDPFTDPSLVGSAPSTGTSFVLQLSELTPGMAWQAGLGFWCNCPRRPHGQSVPAWSRLTQVPCPNLIISSARRSMSRESSALPNYPRLRLRLGLQSSISSPWSYSGRKPQGQK